MSNRINKKLQDTSIQISEGGRARSYWDGRQVKNKRSDFVSWDNKDLDMDAILKEYKLKGFEFGNWLSNNDRYDFLIGAMSSLKDLSSILKTKNIGINYSIGIAFGARGLGGRAMAHYEPRLNMINLTKTKGEGCLAHEYGHALDYTIGTYVDQNQHYRALSGGRSTSTVLNDNTGGVCRSLTRDLIAAIKETQSFSRLRKASAYWHYNTEVFARFFEQWVCYKLMQKKASNKFLTKSWSRYVAMPQYLTEADFKKVLPLADKLMKNISLLLNGKSTGRTVTLKPVNKKAANK